MLTFPEQTIWNLIRETRSDRPGKAATNRKRAAVYGASLQQFEELMSAAASVGYASRPLPLFYAISQAGRAIAAAWADDPWVLSGHGLKHGLGETPLRSTVRPEPGNADAFGRVANAANQGELTAAVELGALWSSLPDLYGQDFRGEPWRRPLPVERRREDVETYHLIGNWVGAVVVVAADRFPASPLFNYDDPSSPGFDEAVAAELAHYPTAEGWVHWRPGGLPHDRRLWDAWNLEIAWETPSQDVSVREAVFQAHAYEYRVRDEWWLSPSLNARGDFLLPLMTWWTLLFGLSMLARYHPAAWTTALQVDSSAETVPLEHALNSALAVVPHYVLGALLGHAITIKH